MKPHLVPALLLLTASSSVVLAPDTRDESVEPSQTFKLTIGDREVLIREGETLELPGTFEAPQLTLRGLEYRLFTYGGLEFRYPREYSFDADLGDEGVRTWSLDGSDCLIMVTDLSLRAELDDFVEGVLEQFEELETEVSDAALKLGDHELKGKMVRVAIGDIVLKQTMVQVPTEGDRTRVLTFQDALDAGEEETEEWGRMMTMLSASFRITKN